MILRGGTPRTETAHGVWWGHFGGALRAEWTKLRTAGETGGLLLCAVVLTAAGGAAAQAVIAVFAVLAISGEYGTGTIRTTLMAVPNRLAVLSAKATVLTAVVLVSGAAAVLCSLLLGRHLLPANGFTEAHGYAPLSLGDGPTLRAAVGSVVYLVLIGLGVATAVREAATAIGIVLGLLYLFPVVIQVVNDPEWQRHLQQVSPMAAGLAVQATVRLEELPIGPWSGLGVLAGWAAAALLVGGLLLHGRDV
ncbi:ABC transporter permease subunit [Streptomyces sp. NPDC058877]|uniref:ABC transporter permease subunit n=1 Tax=Streptomyces sp. NPDC058877 TaxID=3346665 RepID=UPI00367B060F